MGRYNFYYDFFSTDIMTHIEASKQLMKLESEDDKLLVPALFQLAKGRGEKQWMRPFYPNHQDKFKNIYRIIEARSMMQDLRGHKFNIYECASLELDLGLQVTALFTFSMQTFLFACLLYHSISENGVFLANWWLNNDPTIVIIAILITIFFAKLTWNRWGDAFTFNRIFKKIGVSSRTKHMLRWMNIIINAFMAVSLTVFSFFFISISSTSIDAIVNGLAVYFILELDELLAPNWDEDTLSDAVGINIQDYFMVDGREDIRVEMIIAPNDDKSADMLLNSDDKVYIQLESYSGFHAINVFWRRSTTLYLQFRFKISGTGSGELLYNISNFKCIQNFIDIHMHDKQM